jgi:hypothetical protein
VFRGYDEDTIAVLGFQNEGDGGILAYQLPLTAKEPVMLFLPRARRSASRLREK